MCYMGIEFRHKTLTMVIPHIKEVSVSYRMCFALMESFGLVLCDVQQCNC